MDTGQSPQGSWFRRHWILTTLGTMVILGAIGRRVEIVRHQATENAKPHSLHAPPSAGIQPEDFYELCGPPEEDERMVNVDGRALVRMLTYKKYGVEIAFAELKHNGDFSPPWGLLGYTDYPSHEKIPPEDEMRWLSTMMPCLSLRVH